MILAKALVPGMLVLAADLALPGWLGPVAGGALVSLLAALYLRQLNNYATTAALVHDIDKRVAVLESRTPKK